MGGRISCPAGFEQGPGTTCHYKCSNGFAYRREENGNEKCFLISDPKQTVDLKTLLFPVNREQAKEEEKRVVSRGADILTKESGRQTLLDIQKKTGDSVKQYETIRSTTADFEASGKALKETNKELKPLRPPTAPAEDLSLERQLILNGPRIDLLMIQIALFFAVLSLVSFLFLDRDMAQGITFLLLCTGVALGFFLRK